MPYFLSPLIKAGSQGMWGEGSGYEKRNLHSIEEGKLPPVNYDEHIFRPHSLTHMETSAHVNEGGHTIDYYYKNHPEFFYGETLVIKLKGNRYPLWEITREELEKACSGIEIPPKVLITSETYPVNEDGFHDPEHVMILSEDAADFLVNKGVHLYGCTWKSSDYKPGSIERPIHKKLFKNGVVLENLKLDHVPVGKYFMVAAPVPVIGASEMVVVPVLLEDVHST
jgi:arylformamidase